MRRGFYGPVVLATSLLAVHAGAGQAIEQACKTLLPGPQDAVAVAPANHSVLFEDADVRVLDVHSQPHTREAVHTHLLPSVMYFERSGAGDYDSADGTVHRSHATDPNFKPEVRAIKPEGPHYTTNTGDVPFHAIRVEFKHPGCGLAGWQKAVAGPDDALVAAPASHTLLFEDAGVRVLDVHLAAHAKDAPHTEAWPGLVYVAKAARVRDFAGPVSDLAQGGIVAVNAGPHELENVGDGPLHLILFELKEGSGAGAGR